MYAVLVDTIQRQKKPLVPEPVHETYITNYSRGDTRRSQNLTPIPNPPHPLRILPSDPNEQPVIQLICSRQLRLHKIKKPRRTHPIQRRKLRQRALQLREVIGVHEWRLNDGESWVDCDGFVRRLFGHGLLAWSGIHAACVKNAWDVQSGAACLKIFGQTYTRKHPGALGRMV